MNRDFENACSIGGEQPQRHEAQEAQPSFAAPPHARSLSELAARMGTHFVPDQIWCTVNFISKEEINTEINLPVFMYLILQHLRLTYSRFRTFKR